MTGFLRLLELSTPEHLQARLAGGLSLYEAEGYRWLLSSASAIQTAMNLADPASLVLPNHRAMMLASLFGPVDSVLDLGAGGGGFLRHLHAREPVPRICAVERSADMLSIAKTHFALPAEQKVCLDDAASYLLAGSERFDLVLCDLFSDRCAPAAMEREPFYRGLRARVSAGGVLALNTLPGTADELSRLLGRLREHFGDIALLRFTDVGNVVVLACSGSMPDAATLGQRLVVSPYALSGEMQGWLASMYRLPARCR